MRVTSQIVPFLHLYYHVSAEVAYSTYQHLVTLLLSYLDAQGIFWGAKPSLIHNRSFGDLGWCTQTYCTLFGKDQMTALDPFVHLAWRQSYLVCLRRKWGVMTKRQCLMRWRENGQQLRYRLQSFVCKVCNEEDCMCRICFQPFVHIFLQTICPLCVWLCVWE